MGRRWVRQPNGKIMVISTIVDAPIYSDAEEDDIMYILEREGSTATVEEIKSYIKPFDYDTFVTLYIGVMNGNGTKDKMVTFLKDIGAGEYVDEFVKIIDDYEEEKIRMLTD